MTPPGEIRVAIVDDEPPARDRIRRLLRAHPDFVVVGEAGDVASALALIDRERPDLVFLDVHMPGGDGFDVLRGGAGEPRILFTTAHERYAVRAFEVRSIDYLLKPFRADRFAEALARVRATLGKAGPIRLPGRRGPKIVLLDPADIFWFEAEETLVFARTAEGRFVVDRTLTELEELLASTFFRAHRRFLVQLARIGAIHAHDAGTWRIVLRDAEETALPLSRRQARKLREKFPW